MNKLKIAQTELKKARKKLRGWKDIWFVCVKCKKQYYITTTSPELYTPAIIKNMRCLLCERK